MIFVVKIGKWLLRKGMGVAFALAILFLVFLFVTVFYPKFKRAIDQVLDKEVQQKSLQDSIASANQEIEVGKSVIEMEKLNLAERELEHQTILEKITAAANAQKQSAQRELQSRKNKAKKELKELEDNRPWPWNGSYWTGSHKGKILKKNGEIKAMKLGTWALGDDHLLVKQEKEASVKIEKTEASIAQSRKELASTKTRLGGLEFQLAKLAGNVTTTEEIVRAWRKFKPWIAWAVAGIVLTPIVWSLFMYYAIAPIATKQRPIKLVESETNNIYWADPRTSLNVTLDPAEQLWVRNELLTQRAGISKRTATFWNWRAPAVSTLSGLVFCTQAMNNTDRPSVFVLSSNNPEEEISEIVLEEGSSLVLHVTNIVAISGDVAVRARWRILNLNAWLTGQLRFLIFEGPGSIFVGAPRGIEGCKVTDKQMVEQQITIGFDSNLDYSVKRTETFVPYFRGQASLFDDCFEGQGTMFRKNAASHGRKTFIEKTFGSFFAIVGKMLD